MLFLLLGFNPTSLAGEIPLGVPVLGVNSPVEERKVEKGILTLLEEKTSTQSEFLTLKAVAHCESGIRQFDDDSVLRGRINPLDIGVFQINEPYWLESAEKLGYDIHTIEGNIDMALWLYKNQGLNPWYLSKPCWKNKIPI